MENLVKMKVWYERVGGDDETKKEKKLINTRYITPAGQLNFPLSVVRFPFSVFFFFFFFFFLADLGLVDAAHVGLREVRRQLELTGDVLVLRNGEFVEVVARLRPRQHLARALVHAAGI